MASRIYPELRCETCGETVRLIAVCEKPDERTETRFYECSNPVCRECFKSCVPVLRDQDWIGIKRDFQEEDTRRN